MFVAVLRKHGIFVEGVGTNVAGSKLETSGDLANIVFKADADPTSAVFLLKLLMSDSSRIGDSHGSPTINRGYRQNGWP